MLWNAVDDSPPTANAGPDLLGHPGEVETFQAKRLSTNPHARWYEMHHRRRHLSGPVDVNITNSARAGARVQLSEDSAVGAQWLLELTETDRDGESDGGSSDRGRAGSDRDCGAGRAATPSGRARPAGPAGNPRLGRAVRPTGGGPPERRPPPGNEVLWRAYEMQGKVRLWQATCSP